jgi:anthranilate phosphoribosyltransferase
MAVLDGEMGPARDIVLLNAGAALYAANVVDSIADGIDRARAAVDAGTAKGKLAQLVAFTHAASTAKEA